MILSLISNNPSKILGFRKIVKTAVIIQTKRSYIPLIGDNKGGKSLFSQPKIDSTLLKRSSHNHARMWAVEKAVSVGLLGVIPSSVLYPGQMLDDVLAIMIVAHMFWGLEAVVEDYARPIVIGKFLSKLTMIALYIVCFATAGGIISYNHNSIGIGCTIRKIWNLGKECKCV